MREADVRTTGERRISCTGRCPTSSTCSSVDRCAVPPRSDNSNVSLRDRRISGAASGRPCPFGPPIGPRHRKAQRLPARIQKGRSLAPASARAAWPEALPSRESLASTDSAVGRQPREHCWSETHPVGNRSEIIDSLGHAYAGEKIDEPLPGVVFTCLFCIVRKNRRQDVALDPRGGHVLPDVSVSATVHSGREAPLSVQDNVGPVVEHRVLADPKVRLARRRTLQLAQGPKPNDCHVS